MRFIFCSALGEFTKLSIGIFYCIVLLKGGSNIYSRKNVQLKHIWERGLLTLMIKSRQRRTRAQAGAVLQDMEDVPLEKVHRRNTCIRC